MELQRSLTGIEGPRGLPGTPGIASGGGYTNSFTFSNTNVSNSYSLTSAMNMK